jgi:O-antigen ligase
MVEGPIDQNRTWRTVLLAFVIWAAHFVAVYAAGLIFPDQPIVLWIALAACLAALGALALLWLRGIRTTLGTLAIVLSGLFVIYDTLPALLS